MIQRYTIYGSFGCGDIEVEPCDSGDWVNYEDHKRIVDELTPKKAVCEKSPDGNHKYVMSDDTFELPYCKYCYKE